MINPQGDTPIRKYWLNQVLLKKFKKFVLYRASSFFLYEGAVPEHTGLLQHTALLMTTTFSSPVPCSMIGQIKEGYNNVNICKNKKCMTIKTSRNFFCNLFDRILNAREVEEVVPIEIGEPEADFDKEKTIKVSRSIKMLFSRNSTFHAYKNQTNTNESEFTFERTFSRRQPLIDINILNFNHNSSL